MDARTHFLASKLRGCEGKRFSSRATAVETYPVDFAQDVESMTHVSVFATGHSCVLAEGKLLLFFGGEGEGEHYNDIYVLDTEQWNWFVPPVSGEPPSARAYHAAVMCESKMVIIGGGRADGTGEGCD
jgi:N-acetylneuraminic acid mutarotase